MYCKSTDSDNIHIIASMSASSVKGYDYKVVAKGTSNTNYEYLRVAHTTIARMETATIASGGERRGCTRAAHAILRLYL